MFQTVHLRGLDCYYFLDEHPHFFKYPGEFSWAVEGTDHQRSEEIPYMKNQCEKMHTARNGRNNK